MQKNRILVIILVVIALLVISGIGYYQYTNRQETSGVVQQPQTETNQYGETQGESDMTEEPLEPDTIRVYFVDLENKRGVTPTIGCGDSLVAYTRDYPTSNKSIEELITTALGFLLEEKDQNVSKGGAYNALYQSDLKVERVDINGNTANVYLTGEMKLGGTCDSPRFENQIKRTAGQFENVSNVNIFLNGNSLNLSQK